MKRDFKEEDMYPAVKSYFEALGYRVNAEVKDCDVTATKDDTLIILELKKSLSLDLFIQAVRRQKIADLTFMVVPKPKFPSRSKYRDTMYLIKRLSLGLIYISEDLKTLEIAVEPKDFDMKKSRNINKNKLTQLKKEMNSRATDLNSGGQTGRTIMTHYREECIRLLFITDHLTVLRPRDGVRYGVIKTQSILTDNYYGWFKKEDRGKYILTEEGIKARDEYLEIKDILLQNFNKILLSEEKEVKQE